MIKLVFLIRRRADLSFEAFSDYWLNQHADLIKRHAAALGIRRYVQSHGVGLEIAAAMRGQSDAAFYDGVTEIWIDSLASLIEGAGDPERIAIQAELLEDEERFIDHAGSMLFFTEEHEIIA